MLAMSLADFFHKELKDWYSAIELQEADIRGYEKRLAEITDKNTLAAILQQVEHYQNRFIIQKQGMQQLKHDIRKQETDIADDVRRDIIIDKADLTGIQFFLRERVQSNEKIFITLKHDFYNFLARNL